MQKSVYSSDVDEGSVVGEAHHPAFDDISDAESLPNLRDFLALFLLEESLVGEDSLVSPLVYSRDPDRQGFAHEFLCVLDIAIRKLRHGDETGNFLIVCNDTALYFLLNADIDDFFFFPCVIYFGPVFCRLELLLGKKDISIAVIGL